MVEIRPDLVFFFNSFVAQFGPYYRFVNSYWGHSRMMYMSAGGWKVLYTVSLRHPCPGAVMVVYWPGAREAYPTAAPAPPTWSKDRTKKYLPLFLLPSRGIGRPCRESSVRIQQRHTASCTVELSLPRNMKVTVKNDEWQHLQHRLQYADFYITCTKRIQTIQLLTT